MSKSLYPEVDHEYSTGSRDDRLSQLWSRQLRFNKRVWTDRGEGVDNLSPRELSARVKDYVLHIEGELHELLGELDWKMHSRLEKRLERGNALEEYIDVMKYVFGLGQVFQFTPEEIVREFLRKSEVVEYRYAMERRLREIPSENVVAVDLDGVLNDYPACFVEWVNKEWQHAIDWTGPFVTYAELRMKMDPRAFDHVKDEYRRSGAKRVQGVRDGAREMMDSLREHHKVVVISSRPYERFSRIFADTLDWADKRNIEFDALLFHKEKHRKILKDFPRLIAMIEDDPVIAAEVARTGVTVILVENEMNIGVEVHGVKRVKTLKEATDLILDRA